MLDLTEQDFLNISNVTGRIFDIGILRSQDSIATDVCPNSTFLSSSMAGKHVWLSAGSAKDLAERVRHFHSSFVDNPTSTSACVLIRDSMPVPLPMLKDFRVILTIPKGGLVRQLQPDDTWQVVRSPQKLRVLYLASVADKVSAEAGLLTESILSAARKGSKPSKTPRMMFSGKAAAAKANILFDSGASVNFVSSKFAKQTGITVSPSAQTVRLANDEVVEDVLGEANVYVQLGSFHKPVKCYVMNLLFEVDLILGDEFMDRYNCILHYGKNCIMIQKGKRHVTVKSPALPRSRVVEEKTANPSVLSYSQMKRLMRKGVPVYLASLKPMDDYVPPQSVDASSVAGSVGSPTTASPEQPVQPVQPIDPVSSEKKWVLDLLSEFSDVFQDPLPVGLPPVRLEGHNIPTEPGHPPTFKQMYRLSPLEYRELEKQVTAFLKAQIVEFFQSPYGAPVLFVPKPNGRGLRLCVDYRALNSITVKNRCTLPRIDDLLDAVSGSQYFTSLDLTSGYHQILISEEDRPKTAFRTPFGHFQFKVLIEGLTNAPATFQTVMNSIFSPWLKKFVVVYLDDILIFSKSEEEH